MHLFCSTTYICEQKRNFFITSKVRPHDNSQIPGHRYGMLKEPIMSTTVHF
jgi:hypothetical protein